METLFVLIIAAVFIAIGWFIYPETIAASFGNVLPGTLRRVAWGEFLFFTMQFARLINRYPRIHRIVQAGETWVDYPRPVFRSYRRYTFGVFCAVLMMIFYAFNYFGALSHRPGTEGLVWFIFIVVSIGSFTACSRALDVMQEINQRIKKASKYLDE